MSDVNNNNNGFAGDGDNASGAATNAGISGSTSGGGGSSNRSTSGGGSAGDRSAKRSGSGNSGNLFDTSAGELQRGTSDFEFTGGVAGTDSGGGRGGDGRRGRGRPRKSGNAGDGRNSGRFAGSGGDNAGAGAGAETQGNVEPDSTRKVNEPKTGFKRGSSDETSDKKYKKGYRPLMNTKEATQTVGGLFFGASLVLGSHWVLDEDEGKEIGEALGKLLEKFPVKISENPELIEKLFLGFNLSVATLSAVMPRIQQSLQEKNNGILYKAAEKQRERRNERASNTDTTSEPSQNETPNTSFDFAGSTQGFSFSN